MGFVTWLRNEKLFLKQSWKKHCVCKTCYFHVKKPQQIKQPETPNNNNNKTVLNFWSFIIKGSFSKRISYFPLFCNKPCLPPIRLIGYVEKVPSCLPAVWVPCCPILTQLCVHTQMNWECWVSFLSWRWKSEWLVLCIFQTQETSLADLARLVLGRQLYFLNTANNKIVIKDEETGNFIAKQIVSIKLPLWN